MHLFQFILRFEDDGSHSELDEEIILPRNARIIRAVMGVMNKVISDEISITADENSCSVDLKSVDADKTEQLNKNGNGIENKMQTAEIPKKIETNVKKQESALETLARDLEASGKYKVMQNDAKETDMIAFKVFTPNFEKSEYVIGLLETIIGKNTPEQQDYDLGLLIMGNQKKNPIFRKTKVIIGIFFVSILTAGSKHIEHLSGQITRDNDYIRLQINRMDIFDAKILTL